MSNPSNTPPVAPGIARKILAERTHIYVDWLSFLAGEPKGEIHFDNAAYFGAAESGVYFAKDSTPAPPLNVQLVEALAFEMPLTGPTTTITGTHVLQFIELFHKTRMQALLNPPQAPVDPEAPEQE